MTPAATRATRIKKALAKTADAKAYLADDAKAKIRICAGTACHASGRVALRQAIEKALAERGLSDKVAVVETGCHGFCEEGPPSRSSARRAFFYTAPQAQGRQRDHRQQRGRRQRRRAPAVPRPEQSGEPIAYGGGHPLLRAAAPHRASA